MKIPERNNQLKKGLIDFVNYINQFYDTKKLTILEIGSWTGVSAEIFALHFNKVICVDAWAKVPKTITDVFNMKHVESLFDKRISKYENIEKMKAFSSEAAPKIKKIDIVYIDANHHYKAVREDILLWKNKCKLFISGHDYWPKKFPGVVKAVNELLGQPDKTFKDTSWIVQI